MIIVINDTLGAYGGTHTLTLRMCRWLAASGYQTAVFCDRDDNKEIVGKLKENGTKIYCFDTSDTLKSYDIVNRLVYRDNLKVISLMWDKYIDMEILKAEKALEFENIIYCVHFGTFMKGATYPHIIKEYVRLRYRRIFDRMDKNAAIVMMDEDTTRRTGEYFGKDFYPWNPFARIPMICKEDRMSEEIVRKGYKSDVLMTASRAEFPYKGYLLGLIDIYGRLKGEYPMLKLVIVAGGESRDVGLIKDKIALLPTKARQDVEFHHWMDYDTLREKIKSCKLFIGMGTSVLDAALEYKPSIAVKYNTYDVISQGMLKDFPEFCTADEDCKTSADPLIKHILELDEESYRKEAYATFNAVKRCYDIDINIKVLIDAHPKYNKTLLRRRDIRFHKLIKNISRLKHRKDMLFDVNSVEKE